MTGVGPARGKERDVGGPLYYVWCLSAGRLNRRTTSGKRAHRAMNKIRVFVAEDHATVRDGLRLLIESQDDMEVIGEASDGRAAVERAPSLKPDVLLLDVSMPQMSGLQAARQVTKSAPGVSILALTRYSDDAYVKEMLSAGVNGYVLKQSPTEELLRGIRAVARGRQYLDRSLTRRDTERVQRRSARPPHVSVLTERETEVLRRMALGYSNKEIAAALTISVKTVEVHKANGIRKLGLHGRLDVVRYAILQGWMQDS